MKQFLKRARPQTSEPNSRRLSSESTLVDDSESVQSLETSQPRRSLSCGHSDESDSEDYSRDFTGLDAIKRGADGYSLVPNIKPLETLHNSLSLQQFTDFFDDIIKVVPLSKVTM